MSPKFYLSLKNFSIICGTLLNEITKARESPGPSCLLLRLMYFLGGPRSRDRLRSQFLVSWYAQEFREALHCFSGPCETHPSSLPESRMVRSRFTTPEYSAYRPRKDVGALYSWHSTPVFLACSSVIFQTWGLWHCLHFMPVS